MRRTYHLIKVKNFIHLNLELVVIQSGIVGWVDTTIKPRRDCKKEESSSSHTNSKSLPAVQLLLWLMNGGYRNLNKNSTILWLRHQVSENHWWLHNYLVCCVLSLMILIVIFNLKKSMSYVTMNILHCMALIISLILVIQQWAILIINELSISHGSNWWVIPS